MPTTIAKQTARPVLLDLPNGASIIIREFNGSLYLDAVHPSVGASASLPLDVITEAQLHALLTARKERRDAKVKP